MSREVADEFDTQAAGHVHMLLLIEEEQRPLPEDPSPAMLVTRVTERLAQAAIASVGEGEEATSEGLLQVGVFLLGAAAFALTAISHMVIPMPEMTRTAIKDSLLEHLDKEVVEALTADKMRTASPGELVRVTLALLVGACQCVAELEGVNAFPHDDSDEGSQEYTLDELLASIEVASETEDEDEDEDDDEWETSLYGQMIDSLGQTATMAAAAGQQLIERSDR